MKSEPEHDASAPESRSMADDFRRAISEGSKKRSIGLRALGLLVIAVAVWIISRNVSWEDTLHIEAAGGAVEIEGTILGDWREPSVGFTIPESGNDAITRPSEGFARPVLEAIEGASTPYAPWDVTADAARGSDGRAIVATPEAGEPGAPEVSRIEWRPGMWRVLREMRCACLLPALGFLILASLCVSTRWWCLLSLNRCALPWHDAVRYTYVGLFFNAIVPGFNGGDVARAVAVLRKHPDRRSDALMTVVVDRAVGLVAMILIGTAFVLAADDRLDPVKAPVAAFCVLVVGGGALFFSARVRRVFRFDAIVSRLPQSERLLRLDAAAQRLMRRPSAMLVALLFSFANHFFNGLAVMAAGSALGSGLGFADWMSTMTIANTISALPISPGGLGVGEVLYGSLARSLGTSYAIGVATSLVYRLCLYAMSLLGGLVMLLPSGRSQTEPVAGLEA